MNYERYMVFESDQYYPAGGLNDCRFSSDSKREAIEYADESAHEAVDVFDRLTGSVIY